MGVTKGCRKALLNKRKSLNNKQKFISARATNSTNFPIQKFHFPIFRKIWRKHADFSHHSKILNFQHFFSLFVIQKHCECASFFLPCQVVNLHDVAGVDWFVYRWLRLMFLIRESQQICNILCPLEKKSSLSIESVQSVVESHELKQLDLDAFVK